MIQRLLANNRNVIPAATLVASSVKPSPAVFPLTPTRSGRGRVQITGEYTGHVDTTFDIEIVAGSAIRTTEPVFSGQGSGRLSNSAATALDAQAITIELKDLGTPTRSASLTAYGITITARTAGNLGNAVRISIDDSLLATAPLSPERRTPALIQEGQQNLTGPEWDFDAPPLTADGRVPDSAPRLRFEGEPTIFRQYKVFENNDWQYRITPKPLRAIPAGRKVFAVTGGRIVTVEDGISTDEEFGRATYPCTLGTITRTGTGNGTLGTATVGTAAVAETITATFSAATVFSVTGSVSGTIGNGTTGTAFTSTKINFTITAGATAFISGDTFTIPVAAPLADTGSIITLFDLLDALKGSLIVALTGAVINDTAPNGMGAIDCPIITAAHSRQWAITAQSFTGFTSFTVSSAAPTETLTLECISNNILGSEVWSVSGPASGSMPQAITGLNYVRAPYTFVIPQVFPPQSTSDNLTGGIYLDKITYVSRSGVEVEPPVCVRNGVLGRAATTQTLTLTYTKYRNVEGCLCDTSPITGAVNRTLLGIPDSADGGLAMLDPLYASRLLELYEFKQTYIRENVRYVGDTWTVAGTIDFTAVTTTTQFSRETDWAYTETEAAFTQGNADSSKVAIAAMLTASGFDATGLAGSVVDNTEQDFIIFATWKRSDVNQWVTQWSKTVDANGIETWGYNTVQLIVFPPLEYQDGFGNTSLAVPELAGYDVYMRGITGYGLTHGDITLIENNPYGSLCAVTVTGLAQNDPGALPTSEEYVWSLYRFKPGTLPFIWAEDHWTTAPWTTGTLPAQVEIIRQTQSAILVDGIITTSQDISNAINRIFDTSEEAQAYVANLAVQYAGGTFALTTTQSTNLIFVESPSQELTFLGDLLELLTTALEKAYETPAALTIWDAMKNEAITDYARFSVRGEQWGSYQSVILERYKAKQNLMYLTLGLVPGKTDGSAGVTGGWSRKPQDYWNLEGYAPVYSNEVYHSTKFAADGSAYCSQEFAFAVAVACPQHLKYGDQLTVRIDGGAATARTYQQGDRITVPIVAATPLQLTGGVTGDDTLTWGVIGSVDGAFADYAVVDDTPAVYSDNGLEFKITTGGIPWAIGDAFTFGIEAGLFKWRQGSGTWSADLPLADTALFDGLGVTFRSGISPSFPAGDAYPFRAQQPAGPAGLTLPSVRSAWSWTGTTATLTATFTAQTVSGLGIITTVPVGAVITAVLKRSGSTVASPTLTAATAGGLLTSIFTGVIADTLALTISAANNGSIVWLWLGTPLSTVMVPEITLRKQYDLTHGPTRNASALYGGVGVAGAITWSQFLTQTELTLHLALIDHLKENGDEPLIMVPHYLHPEEAAYVTLETDAIDMVDEFSFHPDDTTDRALSLKLPFGPVYR